MSLSNKLAQLRLRKGKSLQNVADALEVSKTHIWQLEKGDSSNPSLELLRKLADYYEVPVSFLAGEDGQTTVEDVQAHQFFRDFQSLSQEEQALLQQTLELLKKNKGT